MRYAHKSIRISLWKFAPTYILHDLVLTCSSGRVSVTALTKKQRKEQKRMDRRHKASQLRRNKKDMVTFKKKKITHGLVFFVFVQSWNVSSLQVLTEKRRLGTRDGPPHLVAVVSLHAGVDAGAITKLLRGEDAGGVVHQERCISGISDSFGLILPRFKQRFTFLSHSTGKHWVIWNSCCKKLNCSEVNLQLIVALYYFVCIWALCCPNLKHLWWFLWTADMHSLLDVAKIADSLVFVLDSTEGWDSYGDYCLSCLFAQGLPSHGGYKPEHAARAFRLLPWHWDGLVAKNCMLNFRFLWCTFSKRLSLCP